ncbi:hypothetical protein [Bosea massiliensis]|uniref:Uncharacterized protein n=1 Tax=Bosea massiliensis TaxID=151419 RepID=A0ABW0PA78_9HYPH
MTVERIRARLKPPSRSDAIRMIVAERGEISRPELLEIMRSRGLVEASREGSNRLYFTLRDMRRAGSACFDEDRVWAGNPVDARNLSRQKRVGKEKISDLSKCLYDQLFQAFDHRRAMAVVT